MSERVRQTCKDLKNVGQSPLSPFQPSSLMYFPLVLLDTWGAWVIDIKSLSSSNERGIIYSSFKLSVPSFHGKDTPE
jgi:hypothetical protein